MKKPKADATQRNAGPNTPKKRKRRGARGVLWLIALMLAASGILRLGGGAGHAIASGLADTVTETGEHDCTPAPDIAEVLALLETREATVREREAQVLDRMQALTVAEAQISRNMAALQEAETSLEATMALASSAAEDDLARLTAVYESMKPKEAAPLFAAMAPEFAAGFLGRMRADAAAAIMSRLDPASAYSISVLLAGRNANAPTD